MLFSLAMSMSVGLCFVCFSSLVYEELSWWIRRDLMYFTITRLLQISFLFIMYVWVNVCMKDLLHDKVFKKCGNLSPCSSYRYSFCFVSWWLWGYIVRYGVLCEVMRLEREWRRGILSVLMSVIQWGGVCEIGVLVTVYDDEYVPGNSSHHLF